MRWLLWIVVGITVALVVALSRVVWVPDIITRREVIVARVNVRDAECVELIQQWAGDGYLTRVRHRFPSGMVLHAVGDPDGFKIWRARMDHQATSGCVRIHFKGEEWRYYYDLQSLSLNGQSRSAQ
jgi:hypothetical protein